MKEVKIGDKIITEKNIVGFVLSIKNTPKGTVYCCRKLFGGRFCCKREDFILYEEKVKIYN